VIKYPRTPHLEGSRLQVGDHDVDQVALDDLRGAYVVVEEKLDGANAGISIGDDGKLQLQSRGHVLVGGPRERHWDLFKRWAAARADALARLAADGRVVYGEWLYAKHTIYYDCLPHYFMEFDVREPDGTFWSTARREAAIAELAAGVVRSVPVVWRGVLDKPARLPELVARSLYKTDGWRERLRAEAAAAGVDQDRAARETDPSDDAEGLYVKVEDADRVIARYKWIRAGFLTAVVDSDSHWLDRPIVPNRLADGVDLFG
jgi:YD repeat-containing protein